VVGAIIAAVLIKLGLSVPEIFLVFGILNLLAALSTASACCRRRQSGALRRILRLLYRVELRGWRTAAAGERVVIRGITSPSWTVTQSRSSCHGRPTSPSIAVAWWMKPFLPLVDSSSTLPGRHLRPIADQGRRGRPALRDLPRRAHHRDRRADEDL
jgi:hypothetical protein